MNDRTFKGSPVQPPAEASAEPEAPILKMYKSLFTLRTWPVGTEVCLFAPKRNCARKIEIPFSNLMIRKGIYCARPMANPLTFTGSKAKPRCADKPLLAA